MDFDLNQDEELLKSLVERFVADRYDAERRRSYLANDCGFCPRNWTLLGELGLIAAPFRIENGGMAATAADLAVMHEALGRGLVVEPLIEATLVAGLLFERLAPDAARAAWLEHIVSGRRRLAPAHRERAARRNLAWVETRAEKASGGWALSGAKSIAPAGPGADGYVVSARISGARDDRDGVAFFLVAADSSGLGVTSYRTIDGAAAAALALEDVFVPREHFLGGRIDDLEDVEAHASIARSAEALGVMELLFATTLDYVRTRKQFGTPIGAFQTVQHRLVSLYVKLEQARSLLYVAVTADPADRVKRLQAIAGARAFISEASLELGHEAIQLHGGMGVSDELLVGHGHKRLVMLSRYPDDPEAALDRYAAARS